MNIRALVPLAMALPLFGAALMPIVRHVARRRLLIDLLSIMLLVAVLAIDIAVLRQALERPFLYPFGGWPGIGVTFLVEPAGAGCAALAALLTLAGMIFSAVYFQAHGPYFHSLLLAFLGAMSGFCLSADLFNQFVYFEMMGIAAYSLTGYKIEETGPLEGGFNFAVMNSIGGIAVLAGIGLLYGRTGALGMAEIGMRLRADGPDILVIAALVLILAGLFVKGALVPFHFWLPDAHAVAPTAASVLFSGVMVEIAILALTRIWYIVFAGVLAPWREGMGLLLVILGTITAIGGGLMSLLQRHLKRLLAFSTISHVGIMAAAAGFFNAEGQAGLLVYLAGHGMVKGVLFLCAGIVLHRRKSVDELDLRGRCRDLTVTAGIYFLAAAALAGVPPFATFHGKSLIEEGAGQAGYGWFIFVAIAASALTSTAVMRAGIRMFLGWGKRDAVTATALLKGSAEGEETRGDKRRTPLVMLLPAVLLLGAAAAAGIQGEVAKGADAAARFFLDADAASRLLDPSMPLDLPHGKDHRAPVSSYIGSGAALFGSVVGAMVFLAGIPRRKASTAAVAGLRRLHSGYVGDYVAWFTIAIGFLAVWLLSRHPHVLFS